MSKKPWSGRFSENTDRKVEDFTSSIDIDKRLYAFDIEGSIAHCRTLAKGGVISEEDADTLTEGLQNIKHEIERGEFQFDHGMEDIHMHIEARLVDKVGKIAQKLHTARSRNDQVALDVRMYLRDEIHGIIASLVRLRQVIVDLAKVNIHVVLPGYTHLQRAQPVLLSHHLMAYYEMFTRDTERFKDGLRRTNVMPLGSAALAGTTYPIDREYTAELLDFPRVSANSIDAVSDRDFIVEFISAASLCMLHLSRMSEELIIWSSAEFGFIELPDSFATGSSIMPQKKNPDVPELVRGRTGRVFGDLVSILTIMKSLPLSYNRDMQEDKAALFNTVDTLTECVDIYSAMLPKIMINQDAMMQATTTGYLNATDMADYLVTRGMPFRQAHDCVGNAVAYASSKNRELHELDLEELRSFSTIIQEDIFDILSTDQMISRRTSTGGTAAENVSNAIRAAEEDLGKEIQGLQG